MTEHKVRISWTAVGIILAIIGQTVVLGAWAGGMDRRVTTLEAQVAPLTDGTVARLDERTVAIRESVARIERRLEAEQ